NPASAIRSAGSPACSTLATTASTSAIADERNGSFASSGAVNGSGYHVNPAACGARYAKPGCPMSCARERMLSALAPRPCSRISAARARSSGAPSVRTGCPACGFERDASATGFLAARQLEFREHLLDDGPLLLVPRRQAERGAQALRRLVE